MNLIVNAFWAGMLAALITAIWISVASVLRFGSVNQITLLGRLVIGKHSRSGLAALLGMVPHLIIGGIIGGLFGWLADNNAFFVNSTIESLLILTFIPWLIMGLVLLPVTGHGLFGLGKNHGTLGLTLGTQVLYAGFLLYFFSLIG